LVAFTLDSRAQTGTSPRSVNVDGGTMRIWTSGLEERQPGRPVLILEAGAGEGLENWRPIFNQLAGLAPVFAYDRRGIGGSAADTQRPSLRRVAQSLHALLQQTAVAPPYVLVGHSWGGLFVRAFAALYSGEVAGLVFLEVTDFESTDDEKAAAVPSADRDKVVAPPAMPPIPPDTPPGLRAEYEVVASEMTGGYPEARSLGSLPSVAVAVLVATPANRLRGLGGIMTRLQIRHQTEWALTSPRGMFVTAGHVGHMAHRDDPALVTRLVDHVLRSATVQAK
jgi:pimeloyl-ACP methyl ester carboxylesterase